MELVLNSETILVFNVVGEILPSDGAEVDTEKVDPLDFRIRLHLERCFKIAEVLLTGI